MPCLSSGLLSTQTGKCLSLVLSVSRTLKPGMSIVTIGYFDCRNKKKLGMFTVHCAILNSFSPQCIKQEFHLDPMSSSYCSLTMYKWECSPYLLFTTIQEGIVTLKIPGLENNLPRVLIMTPAGLEKNFPPNDVHCTGLDDMAAHCGPPLIMNSTVTKVKRRYPSSYEIQ